LNLETIRVCQISIFVEVELTSPSIEISRNAIDGAVDDEEAVSGESNVCRDASRAEVALREFLLDVTDRNARTGHRGGCSCKNRVPENVFEDCTLSLETDCVYVSYIVTDNPEGLLLCEQAGDA